MTKKHRKETFHDDEEFDDIDNNTHESRILYLDGTVDEETARDVITEILQYNHEDDAADKKKKDFIRRPIKLIVNTYGGSVYDGFGMVTVIETSKTPVHTYVYGKSMSMGFLIAAAGHKRFGGKMATFMYHQIASWAYGKLEELKDTVVEMERLQEMYDRYLLSVTQIKRSDLSPSKEKRNEWYLGSDEAIKFGLIDEII